MAGKAKDLKTLIRLQKWGVDDAQRALGVLLKREDELIMVGEAMDAQLKREQAFVASDTSGQAGLTFAAYFQAHRRRRQALDAQLAALRAEISTARDALAEAFRSLKATEQVRDNRAAAEQAEIDRKEREMMDEIGQNQYRRRLAAERE